MSANPSFYSSLKNDEDRKLTDVTVFGKQMFSLPDFHCAFALFQSVHEKLLLNHKKHLRFKSNTSFLLPAENV